MKRVLLIAVLCAISWRISLAFKPRIVEGSYVTIKDYAYQASLIDYGSNERSYKEPICGASIIASQWLVTAAHCFIGKSKEDIKVKTGAEYRYKDGEEHDIEEIIVDPDFETNYYTLSHDIALIKLRKPIKVTNVQKPILLATSSDKLVRGKILTISGFGREKLDYEKKAPQLKAVNLTIVSTEECQKHYYFDSITDKVICAGTGPAGTCYGDSGGPVVMNGKLVGIVSSGFRCDTTHIPVVFTNVNKYINWISKYVKSLGK